MDEDDVNDGFGSVLTSERGDDTLLMPPPNTPKGTGAFDGGQKEVSQQRPGLEEVMRLICAIQFPSTTQANNEGEEEGDKLGFFDDLCEDVLRENYESKRTFDRAAKIVLEVIASALSSQAGSQIDVLEAACNVLVIFPTMKKHICLSPQDFDSELASQLFDVLLLVPQKLHLANGNQLNNYSTSY